MFKARCEAHGGCCCDVFRSLTIHPDKVRVASGQTAGVDKDGKVRGGGGSVGGLGQEDGLS